MDQNTPYFRELYELVQSYDGHKVYQDVIEPWLPHARQAVAELQQFRHFSTSDAPYDDKDSHLWQWYALSRINDYLLDDFLPPRINVSWFWLKGHLQEWYSFTHFGRLNRELGFARSNHWTPAIERDSQAAVWADYVRFFTGLGFSTFSRRTFHPFYCEIVEVRYESEIWPGIVKVDYVYWPGVMFGNMMFSRSGVRVSCREGTLKKEIAENSQL